MTYGELLLKAKQAKSAEELLTLAKENDIELTEESANAYFEQLRKVGELSDDELDNVAGGGCHATDNRLIVTTHNKCELWACKDCGGSHKDKSLLFYEEHYCKKTDSNGWRVICSTCKYYTYERGLCLCNNLNNIG